MVLSNLEHKNILSACLEAGRSRQKKLGLSIECTKKVLFEKSILDKKILFRREQIIYSDWDYLKNINGGIRNLGGSIFGLGGSIGITRSNHDLALIKLHEDLVYKGFIGETQEDLTTKLEGDDARLYDFRLTKGTSQRSIPLFIKEKYIIIPKEIIHCVESELTIFGELYPIPIIIDQKIYEYYLLARVIGHIPCNRFMS
jgi:hypothetical protein